MKKTINIFTLLVLASTACIGARSIDELIAQEGMPQIIVQFGQKHLILENKGITSLKGLENINNLPDVETISLSENKLENIPANSFPNLPGLKTLLIFRNKIKTIQPGAFKGLVNLENLSLNENNITTILPNTFQGLTKLKILGLTANSYLKIIDPNALAGLNNLEELDVGYSCKIGGGRIQIKTGTLPFKINIQPN